MIVPAETPEPVTLSPTATTPEVTPDTARLYPLMVKVVELMAGQPVPAERQEQVRAMAKEEGRVVIRVTPYATFATPPRHVNKMEDIDTLSHWTSSSQPW